MRTRTFKQNDWVTPKDEVDPKRRRIYYARYYFRGIYGEQFKLRWLRIEPEMVGKVVGVCPSVWPTANHQEFLCIEFWHPLTNRTEQVALHHSEVTEAAAPPDLLPEPATKSGKTNGVWL